MAELDASPLPWLAPLWERLNGARAADRLPHALLVTGPRGLGKRRLVEQLVRALLCSRLDAWGHACGLCADCRLAAAGSHPDLLRVGPDPESKSGDIAIEPIRDLAQRASLTPIRASRKLVIVDPADRMNAAASNALLKTLEEPPGAALLALIAEQPSRLPATIRSRCQWLRVPVPPESVALTWLIPRLGGDPARAAELLHLAYGAPLRVLAELDDAFLEQRLKLLGSLAGLARGERDPVGEAGAWSGVGARLSLDCLTGWLCDLLRLKASAAAPRLDDPAVAEVLGDLPERIDGAQAHRYLRRVLEARACADSTLNPLLTLESLLIEWCQVTQPQGARVAGRVP